MADKSPATSLSEPAFFILLGLSSGPRHGYAVLKDTEALSEGRMKLSVISMVLPISPGGSSG